MNKVKKKNNFSHFLVVFLTSFLLGMIFSLNILPKADYNLLKSESDHNIMSIMRDNDLDLSRFWEVYNLIKINNYDSDGIEKQDLVDAAIKGLVEGLGDKHSEFMTTEETEKFNDVLSGNFEGIGAVVEVNPLGVEISRILKGSPAKKYGLMSGDILIKANEFDLEGLDLFDAVEKIKGKAGTKVILDVLRKGELDVLTIEVTRDKIKIPSIESKTFNDGKIGYISINMFGGDTASEFKYVLDELMDTDGLIIDLRDNGGGYLQSAVSILSNLVENDKTLVVTKYKELFSNVSYPSINDGNIYEGKIVVLINENSASASEITAGALKDYKKAILLGKKSYGKGSVQKPFDLNDGSMVKLTIAKWFTPNDINIDQEGIVPDIEIGFEKQDYVPEKGKEEGFVPYDRQLETAKEVLNNFIENGVLQLTIDEFNESIEK